jgi:3-oxoacyl-[acyl-carrier protein] reductase
MDLGLRGKTVLVTGGQAGMGAGFSKGFAGEGANVIVNYIAGEADAVCLAKEIEEGYGVKASAVYGDVTDEGDIESALTFADEAFGGVDILVNNAGIWPTTDIMDMSKGEWDKVIDVNLSGAFLFSRSVCRRLISRGKPGHIVNIGSKSGISVSSAGHAHYASSKGGVIMFTKALAREMIKEKIVVNAVIPGMVETPLNEKQRKDPQMYQYYVDRLPSGKFSRPEDIANAVIFLASDKAFFTSGCIMDVTGGMLL